MAAEHLLETAVHDAVPWHHVRPGSQLPRLAEAVSGARVPVVDLACPNRAAVVAAIGDACRTDGFFQVVNHGIDAGLIAAVIAAGREFFRLPAEEKTKLYSDDPAEKMRLSTSSNVGEETVRNWRDYLRLRCPPLQLFVTDWLSNPPDFKETMTTYCKEVRELGFRLYATISESDSLGLEAVGYAKDTLSEQEQHMAVDFCLPCSTPELTYRLPAHTDPDALTILLMDPGVAGLQVLNGRGSKWVAVNPQPTGALVVNIGDQLQLKNGFLRALERRPGDLCVDAAVLPCEARTRAHFGEDRASGLGELDPDGIVSVDEKKAAPFVETLVVVNNGVAAEQGALYYSDGPGSITAAAFLGTRPSPYAVQVRVDESMGAKAGDPIAVGAKASGEDGREKGHRGGPDSLSAAVGIVAASSAVTAVAAGAATPAVAFGLFVVLLGGLSLAMASIRGA